MTACNSISPQQLDGLSEITFSNQIPSRFRPQRGNFISLNEEKLINLLQLDLQDYHFPDDYPFAFQENVLYLQVRLEDKPALYIETDFSQENLYKYCKPSPDLTKLLCTLPTSNDIGMSDVASVIKEKTLTEDEEDALTWQVSRYAFEKDYFVITPGTSEIYIIPQPECEHCEFIFKTGCVWLTEADIECRTGHGTGVWTTVRFNLDKKRYLALPKEGANIWWLGDFEQGYIQHNYYDFNVYNLDGEIVYESSSPIFEFLTEGRSRVIFTSFCSPGSLCIHLLEMDELGGVRREIQEELNTSDVDLVRCHGDISWTSEIYLLTVCNRVFFLKKDTLEILDTLEFRNLEGKLFAAHQYKDFLIVTNNKPPIYDQEIYRTTGAKIFDLNKCQVALEASCLVKEWNEINIPTDSGMLLTPQDIYYSPLDAPNFLFVTNEDTRTLTSYNLDSASERQFRFDRMPEVTGSSPDYFLVSTMSDVFDSYKERTYHLLDLRRMEVSSLNVEAGKNLFFY